MGKQRKRKILYHRLILVVLVLFLTLLAMFKGVQVVWNFVGSFGKEEKEIVETKQSIPQIEEKKYTVVIDAGHGGYDEGSKALDGTFEKNITLDIAKKVGAIIEKEEDIRVVYTREDDDVYWTNDNTQDLQARIDVGYKVEADFFVSLHMNDNEDISIGGYEVYMSKVSDAHIMLAENIDNALRSLAYTDDRGLYDEALTPLMIIRQSEIPTVLVEMGFIRNNQDFSYITSEEGSNALANALAKGIIESCHELNQ